MSNQLVANPFQPEPERISGSNNALAQAETQRAVAEIQAALVIAKKFPRDPIAAMDRILNACQRKGLAENALYTYSRGGSDISGPSIRLAETMAQNWGNMDFGIKELSQDNGVSVVEAYAWDQETNCRQVKVFQVPHLRYTKNGTKRLTDPRDIYEMVANQGARRLRACILGVIPGDVIETAVEQCEKTLRAKADVSPEGIAKLVKAFDDMGVQKDQIEQRIQRRLDSIQPGQVVQLRKIYSSIKDGMSDPADWFDSPVEKKVQKPPVEKVQKPSFHEATETKPAPAPAPKPVRKAPEPEPEQEAYDVRSQLDDRLFQASVSEADFVAIGRVLLPKDQQKKQAMFMDLTHEQLVFMLENADHIIEEVRFQQQKGGA